jgi:glycerol-3-phosphate dehydrogenase (NAD(P)+)
MRAAVLGAGSWGTTLAIVLAENGHDVALWDRREARADAMRATRDNAIFLPGVAIPDTVAITSRLQDAVDGAEVTVFVTPTHVMRETARALGATRSGAGVVVTASKGFEEGTRARMSDVLVAELDCAADQVVVLAGPSHAEEVSRHVPTSIVAAGSGSDACGFVQEAFMRPYLRVYTNPDVVGVELATGLKNSIAIAAGILDGLGCGDNTKAALVTRGLAEMTRLGVAMGASAETFSGLAGVGDLVVTCLSRHSRNRRVGEAIGKGATLEDALSGMVMVAEGVRTTRAAVAMGRHHGVELPIIDMVHEVLFEGHDPREAVQMLMTRPPRSETRRASTDSAKGGRA